MRIGYIGLGRMGSALASRFLVDHELTVWDVQAPAVAALKALGATAATSARQLATRCEVVLMCLPRSSDVREVLFGADGIAEVLTPGQLVIDQTSGDPFSTREFAARLAERGVDLLDAPVSGIPEAARQGTVTVMAAGADMLHERAAPVLGAIGPQVLRCGIRPGDAQAMKIVNNAMNASSRLSTLEAVAMGRTMGLTLRDMTDILNKGSGRNHTSKHMLTALVQGRPSTDVALSLMLKDVNQAAALGTASDVPMAITNVTRGLLQIGVNTLGASARLDDVVGLIERMSGTRLKDDASAAEVPASGTGPRGPGREPVVGYVGLGVMGGALARRLLLSRKLHVYDLDPHVAAALEPMGAIVEPDLPSLARACDIIMVCVPTSAIVRQLVFGRGGLGEGLSAGKIVVDQTTGDPSEARCIAADLHQFDVPLVDAPVAGGPRGADAGTIAIYYGGPREVYGQVLPILQDISPNVVFCGATGNGHVAKLVNAAVASANRLVTYECAALGVKYGLRVADMQRVIGQSSGWNSGAERIFPVLGKPGQSANFFLELMVKDLRLGARMAMDGGAPMMISGAIRSLFETGIHRLGAKANLDDMARLFEESAGFEFSAAL